MGENGFPKPVNEVVATAADIFRQQGQRDIADLLDGAHAYFDETGYDNWDGGTYTWALRLEVPVSVFASIEPRLSRVEQEIGAKLAYLGRLYSNHNLDEITILPIPNGTAAIGQRTSPSEVEVRRLWPDGQIRLFLSHVSNHKISVAKLKEELALRGVYAFVAHMDIEPSLDWRNEIELALRSMHAMAAILTTDFHASNWTDQEIGWALGRGILVVPIRLGIDPYGLAGKYQAIPGNLDQPAKLATSIVKVLLGNPQTHGETRRSLVKAFAEASSFEMAIATQAIVVEVKDFTDDEKVTLQDACAQNVYVASTPGVVKSIGCNSPAAVRNSLNSNKIEIHR